MHSNRERTGLTRSTAALVIVLFGAAVTVAGVITGGVPIPSLLALPPVALVAVLIILSLLPLLLTKWRIAISLFFVWLIFEDLVRKLAGNDLRVYFVKDLIYIVALVAIVISPEARGTWKEATGRTRLFLYALVAWGVVMAVPSAMQDWRLPLLGLRFDFFYAPLVVVGFLLGRDKNSLRRSLVSLACIGALASGIGVVQAVIGPEFLAPSQPTPGLDHLVTVRGLPTTGPVYRPTGPFVDPGRYAVFSGTTLAAALAAIVITQGRQRILAFTAAALATTGIWVSGGRSLFILGLALIFIALVAPAYAERRPSFSRAVPVACAAMIVVGGLTLIVPDLFTNRLGWYQATLDPRSSENEWAYRWQLYGENSIKGIKIGGLIGRGTGVESLGKPYLLGVDTSTPGLYQVESGYGSVAVEWGVVGLALWLSWSIAWFLRAARSARVARGNVVAGTAFVLSAWMFIYLFIQFYAGYATFQNYLGNAYFWFFSGIIFSIPVAAGRIGSQGRESESHEPEGVPKAPVLSEA